MLINLSNHPSSSWSREQLTTALSTYHQVQDLTFPNIPPSWSSEQIQKLAQNYKTQIVELLALTITPSAVHLMGEMTFSTYLVYLLQREGIICIASTTQRNVVEQDGVKQTRFEFVRFRDYPEMIGLEP